MTQTEEHWEAEARASPRPRLNGAERRRLFLEAAEAILIEAGPSAVTMDGVAARTGVNKRLPYRFFANRDEMLRELLERELQESGRRARALLPAAPSLEQRVSVNVRVWLEIMQERGPVLSRLLFDQGAAEPLARDVNRRALADWTQVYRDEMGVSAVTAEILARMLIMALRGAVDALQRGLGPLDEVADIYTKLTLAAAREVAKGRVAD
jgi:AcrR family transcriptional regulator